MSHIKSFSIGNGDMFYIKHNSDNFSIIDCCITNDRKSEIIEEIKNHKASVGITRFISTSCDNDHIRGLRFLDENIGILNFYLVDNRVVKNEENEDFVRYCELKNDENKAYKLYRGCNRKWLNQSDDERKGSGLEILWPILENKYFLEALEIANNGGCPNNISPIIKYSVSNGPIILWMGDLETGFISRTAPYINFTKIHILFAPHHGRDTGKIPKDVLDVLKPEIIIIGEAPSDYLNYYQGYNTITQNSAGDITLEMLVANKINIYASNPNYSVNFLNNDGIRSQENYLGTLYL